LTTDLHELVIMAVYVSVVMVLSFCLKITVPDDPKYMLS
jgi:hypothetical protein